MPTSADKTTHSKIAAHSGRPIIIMEIKMMYAATMMNVAVRKVDELHDAVHHAVAQGHQGINAAHSQAIDDLYNKIHELVPSLCVAYYSL